MWYWKDLARARQDDLMREAHTSRLARAARGKPGSQVLTGRGDRGVTRVGLAGSNGAP